VASLRSSVGAVGAQPRGRSTRSPAPTGHRTLAEQFRSWPDERLVRLLHERPDLATPAPHDSAHLASRTATRSSLSRALDRLTRVELCVLDALVVVSQTTPAELMGLVDAEPAAVDAAIERLVDLAVVWEAPGGLRPLTGVAETLTGGLAGGISAVRPLTDGATVADAQARLALLSPPARALLDHVDAQGGTGSTGAATARVRPEDATTPAEELVSRRLLVPQGDGLVHVPGDVSLALRGGRTTRERVDQVPALATTPRASGLVDRTAAGAAFETVRRVELLLDQWGAAPPAALRSGGLGVRDLKAAAAHLHLDEPGTALLVEVAAAAGLLAQGLAPDGEGVWLPTDGFDLWSGRSVAERWLDLANAWLASPRTPARVGSRDPDLGGGRGNALAPELASTFQVESRRMALEQLATLPDGEVLASGTGLPSLAARVTWLRPRRPRAREQQVASSITEAELLGVAGLGGLSGHGRALLRGDAPEAIKALDPQLPQPVDHVLLQADLTAVAPGPLESSVGRTLHLVADVESRGGATVYRFTPGSVRRAFDVGWSATEVHDFIASVSRTPVPQPLTYLVDDVSRTFGTLRVGHAEAFLRADDEAALAELMHDPRAGTLGLRRIAPTVLVSSTPLDVLLPRLRELGAAPVVEAADGTVRVARPDLLRARSPRARRGAGQHAARESSQVSAALSAVRSGDRAAEVRPTQAAEPTTPSGALAMLRDAAEGRRAVQIGYVDNHGASSERVVDPIRVEGGQLTAHDHRSDDTRTFAIHRITTVRPLDPTVEQSGARPARP
jgi:Helicase conserved C-terminal domain/WYL domain